MFNSLATLPQIQNAYGKKSDKKDDFTNVDPTEINGFHRSNSNRHHPLLKIQASPEKRNVEINTGTILEVWVF